MTCNRVMRLFLVWILLVTTGPQTGVPQGSFSPRSATSFRDQAIVAALQGFRSRAATDASVRTLRWMITRLREYAQPPDFSDWFSSSRSRVVTGFEWIHPAIQLALWLALFPIAKVIGDRVQFTDAEADAFEKPVSFLVIDADLILNAGSLSLQRQILERLGQVVAVAPQLCYWATVESTRDGAILQLIDQLLPREQAQLLRRRQAQATGDFDNPAGVLVHRAHVIAQRSGRHIFEVLSQTWVFTDSAQHEALLEAILPLGTGFFLGETLPESLQGRVTLIEGRQLAFSEALRQNAEWQTHAAPVSAFDRSSFISTVVANMQGYWALQVAVLSTQYLSELLEFDEPPVMIASDGTPLDETEAALEYLHDRHPVIIRLERLVDGLAESIYYLLPQRRSAKAVHAKKAA